MILDLLRVHRLALPLVRPFRTSFGTETVRDVIIVEAITSDGTHGWGECSTMSWPGYSSEYSESALDVMRAHLVPALAGTSMDPQEAQAALAPVRGHYMAKSAVLTAMLDAWLRQRGQSLGSYLGAVRSEVDCGVSVGIPSSIDALIDEVDSYVEAGYRRIKLKMEPGWDLEPVRAIRERHPAIALQTDANQAYTREDIPLLARLDDLDLLLIEQPLPEEDWFGHVLASRACRTPICMDESILTVESADSAIRLGAASIINIKPGRVGGYLHAKAIHDRCVELQAPVWCGGMLETGLGRAANVALAALPGFTLPGDTSASNRYFSEDVTEPFVLKDGRLAVPTGPGIGVDPLPDVMAGMTVSVAEMRVAR
jgi:O-succinylbenzoate synthase